MYEVVLRREAQIELDETFVWYELQKTNLGFDFIYEFEKKIDKISHSPYYASYVSSGQEELHFAGFSTI